MALSQAAYKAEQALGHGDNATTAQDVTNPGNDREKYGDPTKNMQALAWMVSFTKYNAFWTQCLYWVHYRERTQ